MINLDWFLKFGAALLIGILIGMQREYAKGGKKESFFAGARTYALISLFGAASALLADIYQQPGVFIGGILLVGLLVVVAYYVGATTREEVGLTSEIAAVLTALIGGIAYAVSVELAVALGVVVTVMLAVKWEFRSFVQVITREDVFSTLQFAVITAIILPVLPNQTYGPPPLNVLNPHNIWRMVVLISGINFLGYILIKVVGPNKGIGLSGLLGGLASSTANTLSFSQRSNQEEGLDKPFAVAIVAGWTIMFLRVLVEVAVVNFRLLPEVWPAMAAMGGAALAYSLYLYLSQQAKDEKDLELSNPFELGPAIKFGLIYGLVLLISKATEVYIGEQGLYISSLIAGLADVDAITLSIADLSRDPGSVSSLVAKRAIILAALSNTASKGVLVLSLGTRKLRRIVWPAFVVIVVIGLISAFLF